MRQGELFAVGGEEFIAMKDVADVLNVSTASVRNWVKTECLIQCGKNRITKSSFDEFQTQVIGREKLTQRANKSCRDKHNHAAVIDELRGLIHNESVRSDTLGGRYEESLSSSYRNKEGVYYTPANVVSRFFDCLPRNCANLSFGDPCCGSGNFLMAAIQRGFMPENVYGYDVDPIAVEISKRRVYDLTGLTNTNIRCVDYLQDEYRKYDNFFDVIFTNPPWGKKIEKQQKEKIARLLNAGNSKDTSALFFLVSLRSLKRNGLLGFLLQDSFFNIATFDDARRAALSLEIRELIDFGKPFRGLITKAKGIILSKHSRNENNIVQCQVGAKKHTRSQASFEQNPKRTLNFSSSQEEAEVIARMFSIKHTVLKGRARFGLGIVTGNNKKHCIATRREGFIPAYKGAEIFKDKLGEPSSYVSSDFSKFQQVAPKELFLAKEKLIYRFISSDLVFYRDTNQAFFLNSANMLVLNDDFPISAQQLCILLNSNVMNWLFRSLYETHKVLRADIESLPIHVGYFDALAEWSENAYLSYLGIEEAVDGTFRVKK